MYPRAACMRAMSCSACVARSLSLMSSPQKHVVRSRWATRCAPGLRSMIEAQKYLGVVVEDLVDVLGWQAGLADVVECLPIRLEGEPDRVVAPPPHVGSTQPLSRP